MQFSFLSYKETYCLRLSTIKISNNKGEYADTGKQRFRIAAQPKYPVRTFSTSSVYLTNYALPTASYWGIRDENTEEMIVDFDTNFTKISCDSTGPYFDVYMDGLQPERYYRILIKTDIYQTTFGPLALYDNDLSLYNALSLYSANDLSLLPAEEVILTGQNLVFKVVA